MSTHEDAADMSTDAVKPYEGFQGRVGRTVIESTPWWAPERNAPEGAPNIVVVLCDDLGFADIGCFGSEIDTPNLDRLAAEGLRYSDFHVEPTCSPTRAALLTGLNPHAVGYGMPGVPGMADPGFPANTWQLSDDVPTIAEILRDNGYATMAVGKWHLSRPIDTHEASSTTSWPTRRGFDRYYGHWGCPNQLQPDEMWSDNQLLTFDTYPDGYYYMDDLTDHAISMIRSVRTSHPTKPYFLYFAHSAPHAPLNATPADLEKYRGAYEAGWDAIREQRFERQKSLGIIDDSTRLAPRNSEPGLAVKPWDELSPLAKKLFARYMEVYAAMVDHIDQTFGRLRSAIEQMGEWENTIVLFTSDNGASREGADLGTSQYGDLIFQGMLSLRGEDLPVDERLEVDDQFFDLIGGPQTLAHYPQGWAMAGNTPFRLYKGATHAGGHQVPMILSWPRRISEPGTVRRQFVHITDVLPTMLDFIGIDRPEQRNGRTVRDLAGTSFGATVDDPAVPSRHTEQYTECLGSRRYYKDGWETVTNRAFPRREGDDEGWELYHLEVDPTEIDDLSADDPGRVKELSTAWEDAAWANQVFPVYDPSGAMFLARAPYEAVYAQPVDIFAGSPTVSAWRSRWFMEGRSFTVRALFTYAEGQAGTIFAHGGQGGGYGLYVEDGRLLYVNNGYGTMTELDGGALAEGAVDALVDVTATAGFRWDVEVSVNGVPVAKVERLPMLAMYAPVGGIDIGIDRRSPVSWRLYERYGAFPYTGTMDKITYTPGEWSPDMGPDRLEQLRAAYDVQA